MLFTKKKKKNFLGYIFSAFVLIPSPYTTFSYSHNYIVCIEHYKSNFRFLCPFGWIASEEKSIAFHIVLQKSKRNETELSKHIWTLKDNNKLFTIKWRIIKQCRSYNNISNICNLCLFEKFVIICKKNLCSLNKRNELAKFVPPW